MVMIIFQVKESLANVEKNTGCKTKSFCGDRGFIENIIVIGFEMEKITYKIVRSSRRTVALVIKDDGTLVVRAPHHAAVPSIERFILEKSGWIRKKSAEILSRPRAKKKEYAEGERFLYLGKEYVLKFSSSVKKIAVNEEFLMVPEKYSQDCQTQLDRWYRREARRIITERAKKIGSAYKLSFSAIRIGTAKRRWGSCTSGGTLSFGYRLVMAPMFIVDCVVAHELCHTKELNHSKDFYRLLFSIIPNYKTGHAWLKKNGQILSL
jgi:hypothetical protein